MGLCCDRNNSKVYGGVTEGTKHLSDLAEVERLKRPDFSESNPVVLSTASSFLALFPLSLFTLVGLRVSPVPAPLPVPVEC